MKVYKFEVLVIDFEGVGPEGIKDFIEGRRDLFSEVKSVESVDIGDWTDEHPLNSTKTCDAEYDRLFNPNKTGQ